MPHPREEICFINDFTLLSLESEGAVLTFAMENIALSEQIFIEAKKG